MMSSKVRRVGDDEVYSLTRDARIVALRWDLVPWALVLDLDVLESERTDAQMYRAWLVFDGVGEISWPFFKTRIPTGCWSGSELEATNIGKRGSEFAFRVLMPRFDESGQIAQTASQTVLIHALRVFALRSTESSPQEDYGLSRSKRCVLASDEDLLILASQCAP